MSGTQVTLTTPETGATPPVETPAVDPNRPAWLPTEFKDVEAYNKSFAELRADHTRKSQELARLKGETPAEEPTETPSETPADPPKTDETPAPNDPAKKPDETPTETPEDAAKKVAEAAGLNIDSYQEEYATTGDVTPENRAKIAEGLKGVLGEGALDIVNQFVEGQKLVHENDRKLYYAEAGGDADNYNSLTKWAAENLPKEEVEAYNRIVDGGDRNATLLAIRGLRSQYEAKNGRVPNNIRPGGSNVPSGTAPFQSSAEMTAAMRDPRYKTDEAYRANVAARIAASPNL